MKDVRAWITLLALVCFVTGAAAGVLYSRIVTAERYRGPFADYAERLIDEFDLSPERAGHLRVILRKYDSDVRRVRRAREAEYFASLEPDLRPIGIEYNRYIRDKVLPPKQRARFDEMIDGDSQLASAH